MIDFEFVKNRTVNRINALLKEFNVEHSVESLIEDFRTIYIQDDSPEYIDKDGTKIENKNPRLRLFGMQKSFTIETRDENGTILTRKLYDSNPATDKKIQLHSVKKALYTKLREDNMYVYYKNRLQSIVNLIDHLKRINQIEEFENGINSETKLNMCIFRYAENDFYNSTVSFEWWRYENAKKEFFQKLGIDESQLPPPIPVESAKSRRKK